MRRQDLLIAAILVGLSAFAVWRQVGRDPLAGLAPPEVRTLALGEAFAGDEVLTDIGGVDRRVRDWFGPTATVFYSWSTTCPCIPACEERMRALFVRFGEAEGVRWVAVAGEPTDTREGVLDLMVHLRAFYRMLLDPQQRLCARLGFDRAAQLAVVDGDGTLRYRGTLTDDLKDPKVNYLEEVLEAMAAGRIPEVGAGEAEPPYGCEFSAPVVCEDAEDAAPPRG